MGKRRETFVFGLALAIGIVMLAPGGRFSEAWAQTQILPKGQSENPAPPATSPPKSPPPSEGSSNPSDNLSRSGGVIQPPAVADPGMTRPAPNPGTRSMPVIPPPGSSGSNSDVVPK